MASYIKVGSFTGTGSAIDISLGVVPSYVRVYNHNDAGGLNASIEWFEGMANGHGLKNRRQAVAEGGTASYSVVNEKITANGISAFAGTFADKPAGFTIGADADVNASGEVGYYFAVLEN